MAVLALAREHVKIEEADDASRGRVVHLRQGGGGGDEGEDMRGSEGEDMRGE